MFGPFGAPERIPVSNEKAPNRLPATSWTFIHTGKDLPPEDYVSCLNQFITRYWRPVFSFMRREGHGIGDAADLTQDFLVRVVGRDLVHKADSARGKFRTFLFWHAKMFLADQGDSRVSRQTSFERQLVSVSSLLRDEDRCYEPAHHESAEEVFNKRWAAELLQRVLDRLADFYHTQGRANWFALFTATHFPASADERTTQEALARRFSLSRDQFRYALEKTEQRYRHFLHEEVRQEVGADADIADEVRELLALLGRSGRGV
jgi:RNA polymerase sigma factor (sigma-70 family)